MPSNEEETPPALPKAEQPNNPTVTLETHFTSSARQENRPPFAI